MIKGLGDWLGLGILLLIASGLLIDTAFGAALFKLLFGWLAVLRRIPDLVISWDIALPAVMGAIGAVLLIQAVGRWWGRRVIAKPAMPWRWITCFCLAGLLPLAFLASLVAIGVPKLAYGLMSERPVVAMPWPTGVHLDQCHQVLAALKSGSDPREAISQRRIHASLRTIIETAPTGDALLVATMVDGQPDLTSVSILQRVDGHWKERTRRERLGNMTGDLLSQLRAELRGSLSTAGTVSP